MAPWDVLDWLSRRRLSGVLSVERGDVSRRFQVAGGVVTRVTSTHPAELLGRLLVGAGYLTDEQATAAVSRGGEPMGQALTVSGAIAEEDLRSVLELKIRESVYELLSWSEGNFSFDASGTGARRELQVAVPLRACLDDGDSRVALWKAVRERIPDDDTRFRVKNQEGTADELVHDVARGMSVREIMLERHSLPFNIYRALAELIERNVIAPIDPQVGHAARLLSAARHLLTRRSVPRLTRTREELAGEELTAAERAMLNRVDGQWDLMTLVRTSLVNEGDALLTLERLATRGFVAL